MSTTVEQMPSLCPLSDVAFITAEGRDAESFLHGQLSGSVEGLAGSAAPLSAWHGANGRVKAIFRLLRLDGPWLLVTDAEPAPSVASGLARFVLRADVAIREAGADWLASAIVGDASGWLASVSVRFDAASGACISAHGIRWVRVGPRLIHLYGPGDAIAEVASEIPHGTTQDAAAAEIVAGLPRLTPALQDRFLPQMLNLDRLGALDASKGCYPGQEVIARTQNLGAVKRRMVRFAAETNAVPGSGEKVLDESGETVGTVVRAAHAGGRTEMLAVTRLESLTGTLVCDGDSGTPLRREPLPYER